MIYPPHPASIAFLFIALLITAPKLTCVGMAGRYIPETSPAPAAQQTDTAQAPQVILKILRTLCFSLGTLPLGLFLLNSMENSHSEIFSLIIRLKQSPV